MCSYADIKIHIYFFEDHDNYEASKCFHIFKCNVSKKSVISIILDTLN